MQIWVIKKPRDEFESREKLRAITARFSDLRSGRKGREGKEKRERTTLDQGPFFSSLENTPYLSPFSSRSQKRTLFLEFKHSAYYACKHRTDYWKEHQFFIEKLMKVGDFYDFSG